MSFSLMTPIHKVWSWSLRGQGVILKGAGIGFEPPFAVEKFSGGEWWVGGTVKIASALGPDHLILNWKRLE